MSDDGSLARGSRSVLAVVFITTLMMSAGTNMLNIAVPAVATEFRATAVASTLLLMAYPLFNTMLIIPAGQLADVIDRRAVFLGGVGAYAVLSVILGFSPTMEVLLVGRAAQGVAAAMLLSSAVAILASTFPARQLPMAMGVYLSGFSLGQVTGPMLGGVIATALGWEWIFWTSAPVAFVALVWGVWAFRAVPAPALRERGGRDRFDLAGAGLLALILGSAQVALSLSGLLGFTSPLVLGLLAVAVALVPVLLFAEHRVRHPVLAPELFARWQFPVALLQGFLVMLPRLGAVTAMGLYFQGMRGDSAAIAAVKTVTFPLLLTIGSLLAARVREVLGERLTVVGSAGLASAGMAAMMVAAIIGHDPLAIIGLGVLGLGNGLFQTLNATVVMTSAPRDKAGVVNAIRTTSQTFGAGIGLAIAMSLALIFASPQAGAAFLAGNPAAVGESGQAAIDHGYVLAYATLLGLMLAGLALSWYRPRRGGSTPNGRGRT